MSLFSDAGTLLGRADIAHHELAPLAASLAHDLDELARHGVYIPEQKALLSREGGRCARDGTLLAFDPYQPHRHACPVCGTIYTGELHHRFWIYWYQLWLAERGVHAALLTALDVAPRFAALAGEILDGYVDRYDSYPNVDNVLGPTRLFFSTYLESIWLLQIVVALDLLRPRNPVLAGRVCDRIVEPSRAIIREYDEGNSNRQVWNSAALLASARVLGDREGVVNAVFGRSGVAAQLEHGLLADGTWYEGENYHLFAHRGLWYGVTLTEAAGMTLSPMLVERFQCGFAVPFATALPDLTLPSRRDSQYAISLRQWRIAEHCELGLARVAEPELLDALQRIYTDDVPRRETGRRTSSADVERNAPASSLSRADLSWRALLFARPTLPGVVAPLAAPKTVLLAAQGLAVFRRQAGRDYVALDYGHSGGGHGHPDRLNLLLAHGETRWLDDYGTGSYVDPSLHWYRSTLAHNAPLFDGRSQQRVNGQLVAFDEQSDAGWIVATADVGPGGDAMRTLVVMDGYLIDIVDWSADHVATLDLPFHIDLALDSGVDALQPGVLDGGQESEDGFEFALQTMVQHAVSGAVVRGRGIAPVPCPAATAVTTPDTDAVSHSAHAAPLALWARTTDAAEWWRATAPGPPGARDRPFRVVRTRARTGRHMTVLAWSARITDVAFDDGIRVVHEDGAVHHHRETLEGWTLDLTIAGRTNRIALSGRIPPRVIDTADRDPTIRSPDREVLVVPPQGTPVAVALGERHFRRSERRWDDRRRLEATVSLQRSADGLSIAIDVPFSHRLFAASDAANVYDNEHPDINGDGVQLYVHTRRGLSGWTLIPDSASSAVRIRPIEGWSAGVLQMSESGEQGGQSPPAAIWRADREGYRMDIHLPAPLPDAIDVIVNITSPGRLRREAQLVMSGAAGEFVYLRGDRHDASRLIPLQFND